MNKTEIQSRIDALQVDFDSKLATLKADLAKCEDGIEQEKCWHGITSDGGVRSVYAMTNQSATNRWAPECRTAYMPECRQVTAEDSRIIQVVYQTTISPEEMAGRLHKLGFRMKVTP